MFPAAPSSITRLAPGELLATWTVCDSGHLAQIARVMAKRCHTAVGAW